jgi:hypothetical protein
MDVIIIVVVEVAVSVTGFGVVTAAVFVVPPPLVTGAAAMPVVRFTDRATDPCPIVVVPLVKDLPSL